MFFRKMKIKNKFFSINQMLLMIFYIIIIIIIFFLMVSKDTIGLCSDAQIAWMIENCKGRPSRCTAISAELRSPNK